MILEFIENYWMLILGILVFTEVGKRYFVNMHPKWVTLLITVVFSGLHISFEGKPENWTEYIIVLGLAILCYDYFLEIALERLGLKDKFYPNDKNTEDTN